MRWAICNVLGVVLIAGCASHRNGPSAASPDRNVSSKIAATQPILYHRTGGIAGTDDRVVIWPDRVVDVRGKLLPESTSNLTDDRFGRLIGMFDRWDTLSPSYLTSNVMDGYTITISYGGKTVEASDLAPNLPEQFRKIFTEIESIAAQASTTDIRLSP